MQTPDGKIIRTLIFGKISRIASEEVLLHIVRYITTHNKNMM